MKARVTLDVHPGSRLQPGGVCIHGVRNGFREPRPLVPNYVLSTTSKTILPGLEEKLICICWGGWAAPPISISPFRAEKEKETDVAYHSGC